MACAPCARKAAARRANALANKEPIQPLVDGYVKKKYIGPSAMLSSQKNNMSYGYRNTGDILIILEEDYLASQGLWEDV